MENTKELIQLLKNKMPERGEENMHKFMFYASIVAKKSGLGAEKACEIMIDKIPKSKNESESEKAREIKNVVVYIYDKDIQDIDEKSYSEEETFSKKEYKEIFQNRVNLVNHIPDDMELVEKLMSVSDVKIIKEDYIMQAKLFLSTLFDDDDYIYYDELRAFNILQKKDVVKQIEKDGEIVHPFTIVNSFNKEGAWQQSKNRISYTIDKNVMLPIRYIIFEIDKLEIPIGQQLRYYIGLNADGAKVRTLTFSGKKSIHAILDISEKNINSLIAYEEFVLTFKRHLRGMGFDTTTLNTNRKTRIPGHNRLLSNGESSHQALLYASKDNAPILDKIKEIKI